MPDGSSNYSFSVSLINYLTPPNPHHSIFSLIYIFHKTIAKHSITRAFNPSAQYTCAIDKHLWQLATSHMALWSFKLCTRKKSESSVESRRLRLICTDTARPQEISTGNKYRATSRVPPLRLWFTRHLAAMTILSTQYSHYLHVASVLVLVFFQQKYWKTNEM